MIRQIQQIRDFLREHSTTALTLTVGIILVLIFIIVFILFWYLPIATDIRFVRDRLSHSEEVEIHSNKNLEKNDDADYDREKIVIAVHEDVLKTLDRAEILIKEVKQSLSSSEDNEKKVTSGINDTLRKWEVSAYEDNPYNLKVGSHVIVSNKAYGTHRPSAIFEVVSIAKKGSISQKNAEIFMNTSSAEFLDIPNPQDLGLFHVTLRILPIHTENFGE